MQGLLLNYLLEANIEEPSKMALAQLEVPRKKHKGKLPRRYPK